LGQDLNKENTMDGQTVLRCKLRFNLDSCGSTSTMALAIVFAMTLLATHALEAQTFSVLHNFNGDGDGASPFAGVTIGPPEFCTEQRQRAGLTAAA
jgi:hypothetical protein